MWPHLLPWRCCICSVWWRGRREETSTFTFECKNKIAQCKSLLKPRVKSDIELQKDGMTLLHSVLFHQSEFFFNFSSCSSSTLSLPGSRGGFTMGEGRSPLHELAVHRRALCEYLWVRHLVQDSEGVLAHSPTLGTSYSMFGLHWDSNQ